MEHEIYSSHSAALYKPISAVSGEDVYHLLSPGDHKPSDEPAAAAIVHAGWVRAQAGLLDILRFGALLLRVGDALAARSQLRHKGPGAFGLKQWLSEHCPEVNYKTATGYMAAAKGLIAAAKLAADRPLLPLMGEKPLTDAEEEAMRGKVMDILATSSLRLLKEAGRALPAPPPSGAGGRPPKAPADPARDALHVWTLALDGIRRIPEGAYRLLPVDEARGMRDELLAAADRLDARVREWEATR